MKFNKLLMLLLIFTLATGCGGGGGGGSNPTPPVLVLVSLSVTPANPSLSRGSTQQFIATGTYADSSTQDLTTLVTWSSSSTAIATISNAALATAIAAGTTTIKAASGSISGTTILAVTPAPATLLSLSISPSNPGIALGAAVQFTATGTYSDNSTQNLTTAATWASSAPAVATISNTTGSNGRASSVAAGTTTITVASGSISGSTILTVTGGVSSVNNVLPITVNGSLCAANSYPNKPCVSVTVCTAGGLDCQTITDILLDTGSYGLRVFKELLPAALQQATGNSGLAECVQFGDGSSLWGAVQTAGVILGNEPAVSVPIQAVSSTFGTTILPTACSNARQTPAAAGFNGILGVGLFSEDCGATCSNSANNGRYYSCTGSTCSGTKVLLANQVQNPVALLPVDKNGVIIQLPSIPLGGAIAVDGKLILGIDTQSNNASSGVTAYKANQSAQFTTTFSGVSYSGSFIDSGSNGLFFSSPSPSLLPNCTNSSGWYCPLSPVSLFATNTAVSGSPVRVDFQIGNATNLFMTANKVFVEIGGSLRGGFDWGLPFFLGRNVYVGFDQTTSLLGTGPYWAY